MVSDSQYYSNVYKVINYLYMDVDILRRKQSRYVWIGFILVCMDTQEKQRPGQWDIVVAWGGTQTAQEWIEDVMDNLVHVSDYQLLDSNTMVSQKYY